MHRETKQRSAILKLLNAGRTHLTADEIYDDVRKKIPDISMGTIYRNLKVLEKMGKIRELAMDDVKSRFEAARNRHYHFRCDGCGRVIDIDMPVITELDREITRKTGLKILSHHLEFHGLCHECQSTATK